MGNHRIVKSLFLFTLLILWCFTPDLANSVQKKTPPSPIGVKPPEIHLVPFTICGTVKHSQTGAGVQGIEIILTQLPEEREASPTEKKFIHPSPSPEKKITDADGRYSFAVDSKYKGKKFKVVPRYFNFSPGQYFSPQEKTFTLEGSMTLDFIFKSPLIQISGVAKLSSGGKMRGMEIMLDEVLGPHQFKFVGKKITDSSGYKFELPHYGNFGKKFLLRAWHPQTQVVGLGFTPDEKIFHLNGDTVVDFVYNGPLPDLTVLNVQIKPNIFYPEWAIFTVKNQGGLKSKDCWAKLEYHRFYFSTKKVEQLDATRKVPPLGPGESCEIDFWFLIPPDSKNIMDKFWVDIDGEVIESNKYNNTWPKE